MKKALIIIAVVAVIFGIIFITKSKKPKMEEMKFVRKVAYSIAGKNDVTLKKECFSKIEGSVQTEVYPDVPGRFVKYTVSEGAYVNKGDVVAEADRSIPGMTYEPTKITAPISGVIYDLTFVKGDPVAPSMPVAMVTDNSKLFARISLSSDYLSMVKTGDRADVVVGEKLYTGRVVRKSHFSSNLTQLGSADIVIEGSNSGLVNRSCRVYVYVSNKKGVLSVPKEAFIEKEGEGFVFLFKEGKAVSSKVEFGIIGDSYVEVLSGVSEGDTVVTTGKDMINDGQQIRVE